MGPEKFDREPTHDELAQTLVRITESTDAEKYERKRLGLTQEPEAKRIKKGTPTRTDEAVIGENLEINDSDETDSDLALRLEKEGWKLVKDTKDARKVGAEENLGKDVKIVSRGERYLVFERPGNTLHENYDVE